VPARASLERLHGVRPVDVHDRVELAGDVGVEPVALTLRIGAVDDAHRALEALAAKDVWQVPSSPGRTVNAGIESP
jgi:hypothetical protein